MQCIKNIITLQPIILLVGHNVIYIIIGHTRVGTLLFTFTNHWTVHVYTDCRLLKFKLTKNCSLI